MEIKTSAELKLENDALTEFYEKIQKNDIILPNGVIDFEIFSEFLLKSINFTLAWCAGKNPEAPSDWIKNTLIKW